MIRKLAKKDYIDLQKLFKQLYEIHYTNREDVFNQTHPIIESYFKEILYSKSKFCYVYEMDNQLVGAILIKKYKTENYVTLKPRTIYEIYDLVVDKAYRRQGIGTELYNFIIELAQKYKIDAIQVEVWAFNHDAIKFYESIGMNVKKFTYEHLLQPYNQTTEKLTVRTVTKTKL